ncbi:Hypothetical protein ING2D1G_1511 [Peptoniphilus sp. ING2-D1G]|nr:Hypothetical protein ING2D1G_1511 [Peptoniphilus sp. ING2-D1G]
MEKFFDTVNQSRLIEIISDTVKDSGVVSLIDKYLKAGVVVEQKFDKTYLGVPRGAAVTTAEQYHAEQARHRTRVERAPVCAVR